MEKIISETEMMAYDYLKAFGFSDDQITSLITQGKKDLYNELKKLKVLLDADSTSNTEINNALHALKGLLFQLGNHAAAEKLVEIKSHLESDSALKEIEKILYS